MTDDERVAKGRELAGRLLAGAPPGRRLPPSSCARRWPTCSATCGRARTSSCEQRSLITCTVLVALGREPEQRLHFRGARNLGIERATLEAMINHVAYYAGLAGGRQRDAHARRGVGGDGRPGRPRLTWTARPIVDRVLRLGRARRGSQRSTAPSTIDGALRRRARRAALRRGSPWTCPAGTRADAEGYVERLRELVARRRRRRRGMGRAGARRPRRARRAPGRRRPGGRWTSTSCTSRGAHRGRGVARRLVAMLAAQAAAAGATRALHLGDADAQHRRRLPPHRRPPRRPAGPGAAAPASPTTSTCCCRCEAARSRRRRRQRGARRGS